MTERFGFRVVPTHSELVTSDYGVHEVGVTVKSIMSWVYGYDPETKSFRHFPYNENMTRALNPTSLKCSLPSTDAIDRREKIHACVWSFKVASCKRAPLQSTRCSKNKVQYFLAGYMALYQWNGGPQTEFKYFFCKHHRETAPKMEIPP